MSTAQGTGLLSIGEAAKQYSVSIGTIRRYTSVENGLPCYRVGRGKRRFLRADLDEFFGRKVDEKNSYENGQPKIAVYCRVSDGKRSKGLNKNESSDLQRQRDRLLDHVREEWGPETKIQIYCETSSGLNFERKQFNKLVDSMLSGEFKNGIIYATTRERIMRLGLPLFEKICRWANCKLIYGFNHQQDL
jgi:excisionase family DNA binding protein